MIPLPPPWTTNDSASLQWSTSIHHLMVTNHCRLYKHPQWKSGGCVVAVSGRCSYRMALCGLNRWGGGLVLCSYRSRAGNWLGRRGGSHPSGHAVRREGARKKRNGVGFLFLSCRLLWSLRLTTLWPPSWFPAAPGVTWSLWAPGQELRRDEAGSALPLWREKTLRTPGCRAWPVQWHLRRSQKDFLFVLGCSNWPFTELCFP